MDNAALEPLTHLADGIGVDKVSLFVGDQIAASDDNLLRRHKIMNVLNCAGTGNRVVPKDGPDHYPDVDQRPDIGHATDVYHSDARTVADHPVIIADQHGAHGIDL